MKHSTKTMELAYSVLKALIFKQNEQKNIHTEPNKLESDHWITKI
jgi:hypothetical protein